MARKKAVTEPQEEQVQDAAPMEGIAAEGGEPVPGTPMDGGGDKPISAGDGLESTAPGDFPDGGDIPFEGAVADDSAPQGMEPGEPPAPDGLSPGDGEDGMDDAPVGLNGEGDGEDYDALLAVVSQGGMEPVPLPEDRDDGETDIDGEG